MSATWRWSWAGVGGLFALFAPAPAAGQEPSQAPQSVSGLELGLRTGYLRPFGKLADVDQAALSDYTDAKIPLTVALGGRTHTWFSFALTVTYGVGLMASKLHDECDQNSVDCSVHDLTIGPELLVHFAPTSEIDPWLSLGTGYEWWTLDESSGQRLSTLGVRGWQYLNPQVGLAIQIASAITIAPSLSFSLGRYSKVSESSCGYLCAIGSGDIERQAMHGWIGFGLRVTALVRTRHHDRGRTDERHPAAPMGAN